MTEGRRAALTWIVLIAGFVATMALLLGDFHQSGSQAVRIAAGIVAGLLGALGVAVAAAWWRRGRRRDELAFLLLTFFFTTRALETWSDLARTGTLHDVLDALSAVPSIAVIAVLVVLAVRWLRARRARTTT